MAAPLSAKQTVRIGNKVYTGAAGEKALKKKLLKLGKHASNKAKKKALDAGGEIIEAEAAYLAPVGRGYYWKKGIGKVSKSPGSYLWAAITREHKYKGGEPTVWVGPDYTKTPIGHLVEYGHAGPGDAGGEKVVPAHPFMRPAYDKRGPDAAREMGKVLGYEIEREAERG